MQLILAIVADHQQAAQLAALIDGRLAVELVQAAEVGEGLLALDDRIPDLILTSPLMSPFDDGVLDEYLRDLGPAGAHVQSLRIPVLSQAPKKAPRLGFSLRRRAKPAATTLDGCEPKVFADEIALYLARAAEEKSHASTHEPAPVIEHQSVQDNVAAQPIGEEEWMPAYSSDAAAETAAWSAPEPEPEATGWRSDLLDRPLVDEAPAYPQPDLSTVADTPDYPIDEPVAALHVPDALVEPVEVEPPVFVEAAPATAEPVDEPPVAHQPLVEAIEEAPYEDRGIADAAAVAPAPVATEEQDPHKATPSFKAALAAIRAAWGKPTAKDDSPAPEQEAIAAVREQPDAPVANVDGPVEVDLSAEVELLDEPTVELPHPPSASVARPFALADSTEAPEVYELSVEPGMNELAPSPPEPSGDRRKKAAKRPTKTAKAKGPRQSQPQNAQDEWGMFDPNRCGFAAVVDKLDEVSDTKVERPRNGGKARVISCS